MKRSGDTLENNSPTKKAKMSNDDELANFSETIYRMNVEWAAKFEAFKTEINERIEQLESKLPTSKKVDYGNVNDKTLMASVPQSNIREIASLIAMDSTLRDIGIYFEEKYGFCLNYRDAVAHLPGYHSAVDALVFQLNEIQRRNVTKEDFRGVFKRKYLLGTLNDVNKFL